MNKQKILILYTSVGLGHKTIAENLGRKLFEAGFEVKLEDILKVEAGKLVSVSKKIHEFVNRSLPWLWSFLYKSKGFTSLTLRFRTKIASKHSQSTLNLINEFKPDAVIATQTTASAAMAFLKTSGLYKGLFGIAFSDFHLHRYWLYKEADFYLANIEEQKMEMLKFGIKAEKIFVCGMSMPKAVDVNKQEVKNKFGIEDREKVCLIASGSLGYGIDEKLIADLSKQRNLRLVVVCGKNQTVYEKIKKIVSNTSVVVLGFYSPMAELYAIANLFISKPGGLSVSESLNYNLPIIIQHMLPGQEELNYEYLVKRQLVLPKPVNLQQAVCSELDTGAFALQLKNNPFVKELLIGRANPGQVLKQLLHDV